MTDPFDDTVARWGVVFQGSGDVYPSHTRRGWVYVAAAIAAADRSSAPRRGDAVWCQIALDTYAALRRVAPPRSTGEEPAVCHADEQLIRTWLSAPWVPPDGDLDTVAQILGYDVAFALGRQPEPDAVTMLVSAAQDAGVFGLAGHRVDLWQFFGDGTLPAHTFTVTVRPHGGPAVSSDLLGADQLWRPGGEPADVVVEVLTSVAAVVNQLVDAIYRPARDRGPVRPGLETPAPASGVETYPIGTRPRPFPPLTLEPTPTPQAPTTPEPRTSKREPGGRHG